MRAYVNLYAFLSQVLPYPDPEHEKLYSFGRFLLPHLPTKKSEEPVRPENDVELQYYRLERVASGAIDLKSGETEAVKSPTEVGTGVAEEEKAPLSEIIEILNERFGTEFSERDRLYLEQIVEDAKQNEKVQQMGRTNPLDNFKIGIEKMIRDIVMDSLSDNEKLAERFLEDKEVYNAIFPKLAEEVYERVRGEK
jgi:type I restriction enzyme R subunit